MTAPKRGTSGGLPVTAEFSEIAHRLGTSKKRTINQGALTPADTRSAWGNATPSGSLAHQQQLAVSYHVGNPTPSAVDLRKPDFDGTPIQLDVMQIRSYDDNPRFFANDSFADIKAGLRANGFTGAFAVTRRRAAPGEPYMLCAGGNSTLEALRQLYNETGDERFKRINCVFHDYQGEEAILAHHLGENLNRGDMKFWEIAVGVSKLAGLMSQAAGKELTQAELERELPLRGIGAKRTTIGIWLFASKRLAALGPACVALTMPDAQVHFQPRLNGLRKLAAKFGIGEESYWADVVNPALTNVGVDFDQAQPFSAAGACDACEVALAEHVGGDESVATIRSMLAALAKNPASTLADLRVPRREAIDALNQLAQSTQANGAGASASRAKPSAEGVEPSSAGSGSRAGSVASQSPAGMPPASNHSTLAATAELALPAAALPLPPVARDADPMAELHEALVELLETAEMLDCVRWWPAMPYGFYMEIPSPQLHPDEIVQWGSPAAKVRRHKQIVWWLLVRLSGQAESHCEHLMDKASAFYVDASDTYGLAAVKETAMGGADRDFEVVHLLTDPNDTVMYWLLRVVDRMRVLNARQPERWPPSVDPFFPASR